MRCRVLPLIFHGTYSCTDSVLVNSRCSYICNLGYQLEGDHTRICLEGGQWSSREPTCTGDDRLEAWAVILARQGDAERCRLRMSCFCLQHAEYGHLSLSHCDLEHFRLPCTPTPTSGLVAMAQIFPRSISQSSKLTELFSERRCTCN